MKLLFTPPSTDDLIRLLKAWKFWVLGAIVGAVIGATFYYLVPGTYRAQATVNVDFNLEQAWPQESDRQQFYYLEREVRKLEDVAWSDAVMQAVSSASDVPVQDLRAGKLQLSQPAEAGWHFYAEDKDPEQAQKLASAWAQAFEKTARENVANSGGLSSFIQVDATQSQNLPIERNNPLSEYLLMGAVGFLFLSALYVLFFHAGKMKEQR